MSRARVVIANFYPVWPPMGGGQRRIYFLARELSKRFDVEIVVPAWEGTCKALELNPHLKEIRVPIDRRFLALHRKLHTEVKFAGDLSYALYWRESHLYQDILSRRVLDAVAAITAHPYSIYALQEAVSGQGIPIVFDSQNVEVQQKQDVLSATPQYLKEIRAVEAAAIQYSDLTIACSESDALTYEKEYGINRQSIVIIENGVDALGVPVVEDRYVSEMREKMGLSGRLLAIFAGSLHFPNLRAIEHVVKLAERLPRITFLILGSVCKCEQLRGSVPPNIVKLGEVDENIKWLAFSLSDIGLNPMEQGSGSNIKMFEYAAAGLTILSTEFGARGVPLRPDHEFVLSETDHMEAALRELNQMERREVRERGARAREAITAAADWTVIGRRYADNIARVARPKLDAGNGLVASGSGG